MKQIGKGRTQWLLLAIFCLLGLHGKLVGAQPIGLGIVAHPEPAWVELGNATTLSVVVKGPVKSLQWRRNGEPIPGADQTTLQVRVLEAKLNPDEYDVVVKDAFGQSVTSRKARVTGSPAGSEQLRNESRRVESIKLQNLFNLLHVFDQVSERLAAPLQYPAPTTVNPKYFFSDCPDKSKVEMVNPVQTAVAFQQALKLELADCDIPRTNDLGEEAGLNATGILIQSLKTELSDNVETRTIEKFAKKLLVRFPHAKAALADSAMDFDISLDGKVTHTSETIRSAGKAARLKEEVTWTRGTAIENPQTGVKAVFLSGRFMKESFGEFQGRDFLPSRESETFNKVRLKIGKDEVVMDGSITILNRNSSLQRFGQVNISVNGKSLLSTQSTVHPPSQFKGQLPFSPKLNGFFINDHSAAQGADQEPGSPAS
ncbi:MAG TPA: hypothetical protein VFV28_06625 [Limnobacter sp.]|nr:hypothetical protein [Limnobacter sp.]